MNWRLVLALLCPASVAAQRKSPPAGKPAAPSRWPIRTLAVEGNRNYTRDQVLAAAGLKVGQLAGKAEFEAARDRLVATGIFETVGYRFAPAGGDAGYAASFQVTEVEPVHEVRFQNLGAGDSELLAWLKTRDPLVAERIPATAAVLNRWKRGIEEFLSARGRKEKVLARILPDASGELVIAFRPDRPDAMVAQVSFQGNQLLTATELQNAVSAVAIGSPFEEERFRQILNQSVRPLYEARGRIRVAFPKIAAEPARDVEGLAVTVTVEAGASYNLGQVRVEGSTAAPAAQLAEAAKLKSGETANFDEVAQGLERVRKLLRRNGYMRADARAERHIDESEKKVDLVIHVEEGPRFTFGKLIVEGLDILGEAEIRRLWVPKEGQPFNADYPDFFLRRIQEEGVFENLRKTRSALKLDEQNRAVDVILSFN